MDWKRFKIIAADGSGNVVIQPPPAKPVAPVVIPVPDGAIGKVTLYAHSDDWSSGNPLWKEWHIWCTGKTLTFQWGKCGNKLQTGTRTYRSELSAQIAMRQQIQLKRHKGYKDTK